MKRLPSVPYEELTKEKIDELKIEMWGGEDDEMLVHENIDDFIESLLDGDPDEDFPASITVCGYKRRTMDSNDLRADQILEDILENLDQEYGDPDGDQTDPTADMEQAAQALVEAIKKDYEVWSCEGVLLVEVKDVRGWVKEQRPDWLE